MKLTELNPRWFVFATGEPILGLSFDCPHCRKERLGVSFHHKGFELMEDKIIRAHSDQHIWEMTGSTFEDLTLSPSVDASKFGHWHGFIIAGEVK